MPLLWRVRRCSPATFRHAGAASAPEEIAQYLIAADTVILVPRRAEQRADFRREMRNCARLKISTRSSSCSSKAMRSFFSARLLVMRATTFTAGACCPAAARAHRGAG